VQRLKRLQQETRDQLSSSPADIPSADDGSDAPGTTRHSSGYSGSGARAAALLPANDGPPAQVLEVLWAAMLTVPWEVGRGLAIDMDPQCRYLALNEMKAGDWATCLVF
jgi:hypothetical protein